MKIAKALASKDRMEEPETIDSIKPVAPIVTSPYKLGMNHS